jgi:hypothetical protein
MLNIEKNRLESGAQSITVVVTLTAVLLFGSIIVTAGTMRSASDENPRTFCRIFIPGGDGSMSTTDTPESNLNYLLSIPAVVAGPTLDNHRPAQKPIQFTEYQKTCRPVAMHRTTVASISSRKALEFTLVGAKPSGTG